MRILVSCVPFDHGRSGISVYIRHTVAVLAAAGHDLTLVVEPEAAPAPEFASFPKIVAPGWIRKPILSMIWHLLFLPFRISRRKYDLFFIAAANRRAVLFRPVPTVAVVHDLAAHRMKGKYDRFRTLYQTKILPFFSRRAEFPVAISESTAADMVKFMKLPRERITVSWDGLSLPNVPSAGGWMKRHGLEPGGYLLYISRLEHPAKNQVRLIEAYGKLPPELSSKFRLVLCGADWHGAEVIRARAADSPLHDRILLTGFLANEDLEEAYRGAAAYVADADYAVATLETTFAGTAEYTGYPLFKSPDDLAVSLKSLGFDLINTGSNHCMDAFKGGLVRTLDVLEENGLAHVGTYRTQEERDESSGITVAEVNGIRIAFLSYAYGTNGIPVDDFPFVVNLIYKDYMTTLKEIDYERIDADMAAARALGADVIAVFMHWGAEYQTTPNRDQYALADHLFEQGADLILGGHTHVPEPMELRQVTDINGREKTGYICFSLGNLVSCQVDLYTNLTAVLNIDLEKDLGSGETVIKSVKYVPLYMMNLYDFGVTDAGWRYRLLDLYAATDAYNNGSSDYMTEPMYRSMTEGLDNIHAIMGAEFDVRGG